MRAGEPVVLVVTDLPDNLGEPADAEEHQAREQQGSGAGGLRRRLPGGRGDRIARRGQQLGDRGPPASVMNGPAKIAKVTVISTKVFRLMLPRPPP